MSESGLKSYTNINNIKYYVKLSFSSYNRPSPFETESPTVEKYILLPLPQELRDETVVSYTNENLQMSGDILNGGVNIASSGALTSEILRRSGDIGSNLAGATMGGALNVLSSGLGEAGASAVQTALPPNQIASAVSQYFGVAPNPNPSVAFQGPQLRELNLSWNLAPVTKADSANIRKMINYLKQAALPVNSISKSAAVLDYPKLVQVNFYPWDRDGGGAHGWSERSIIKMKRCFMSAVNVNYTPSNTPAFFHDTNEPVAIQLSISLKEVEYFLASDYGGAEAGKGLIFENTIDPLTRALGFSEGDQGTAPEAEAAPQ